MKKKMTAAGNLRSGHGSPPEFGMERWLERFLSSGTMRIFGSENLSTYEWCVDFRADFVEDKAKFRRLAVASQEIVTQSSAKSAENTCADSYMDRF